MYSLQVSWDFIVGLVGCGVTGFVCGLTWRALAEITVSNHDEDVFSDSCVGSSEFSILGSGYICVFDGCLVHEVLTDGHGSVLEIIGLGKEPWVPHGRLLDAAVHSDGVLDLL